MSATGTAIRKTFVDNLRARMDIRGITQSDIAREFGLTASTVSDWVNGKSYPRIDILQELARYLGTSISDLMNETTASAKERNWKDKEYLRISDIQSILCIGQNTAYEIGHSLPHVRIGLRGIRVSTPAFKQWLKDEERRNAK